MDDKNRKVIPLGLRQELEKCVECPFGGAKVGSRGNPSAPLVFIAESPGHMELRYGEPLVGPAGKLFWSCIEGDEKVATKDGPMYILNAMNCAPRTKKKGGKEDPRMGKAMQACHPRMMRNICQNQRKLIVTMGNYATWSLTGNNALRITRDRGRLIPSEHAELGILPIVHPAAILRGTGSYRQFMMDIGYAFDLMNGVPPKTPRGVKLWLCNTPKLAMEARKKLWDKPFIAADVETTGLDCHQHRILCLGMSANGEDVYVFTPDVLKYLKTLFEKSKSKFIWHNGKFDIQWFWKLGINARVDEDTMLASYALDEMGGIHDLEQLASDLLGAPDYKFMVKQYAPKKSDSYEKVPSEVLHKYLALDVGNTFQIWEILRRRVAERADLEKLYTKLLIPASNTLAKVEHRGIYVNTEKLHELGDRFTGNYAHYLETGEIIGGELKASVDVIQQVAGEAINPNSPAQLAELLFDKLRLRAVRGRSTSKEVLEALPQVPIVIALRKYRKAQKAFATYVEGVRKAISVDGRIHPTFKIHGTRTGRLSCSNPNMQNIPRDPEIRSMFVAAPGRRLIEFDLNQAELRSLAHCSKDKELIRIYTTEGMSLHEEVRRDIFGNKEQWTTKQIQEWMNKYSCPEDRVEEEQKMRAKTVNFGIVYGREAPSLAEEFEMELSEGQRWINAWFTRFPQAHEFIKSCRRAPQLAATMTTPFGRKKRHWVVARETLHALQNEASNFPHQSIASDITLDAANYSANVKQHSKVYPKTLEDLDGYINNLIHDAILVDIPDDDAVQEEVCKLLKHNMETVPKLWGITRVPFKAEGKAGYAWGKLKGVR